MVTRLSSTISPPQISKFTVIGTTPGFSNNLENMLKTYKSDSNRYGKTVNDNFEYKYALYLEFCD